MVALLLALALPLATSSPADLHVHPGDPWVDSLVREGMARSTMFARLVELVAASDVIVTVTAPPQVKTGFDGYLVHQVVATKKARYLRVVIDRRGCRDDVIAVLAHEMQHVFEVAESDVASDAALEALSVRIGRAPSAPGGVETAAAKAVQLVVKDELRQNPRR